MTEAAFLSLRNWMFLKARETLTTEMAEDLVQEVAVKVFSSGKGMDRREVRSAFMSILAHYRDTKNPYRKVGVQARSRTVPLDTARLMVIDPMEESPHVARARRRWLKTRVQRMRFVLKVHKKVERMRVSASCRNVDRPCR